MRALALDVGSKTIGLALGDLSSGIATPWDVLRRQGQEPDARAVLARADEREVSDMVVGLPLELDGREGQRARRVRAFATALQAILPERITLHWWDERFSTAAAERSMLEGDLSRARRKQRIDAMAAQFILQGWLDGRANNASA